MNEYTLAGIAVYTFAYVMPIIAFSFSVLVALLLMASMVSMELAMNLPGITGSLRLFDLVRSGACACMWGEARRGHAPLRVCVCVFVHVRVQHTLCVYPCVVVCLRYIRGWYSCEHGRVDECALLFVRAHTCK